MLCCSVRDMSGDRRFDVILLMNLLHSSCTVGSDLSGSVGCASEWRPGGLGFDPRRGRQYSFVEIDHEIFSHSLPSADSRWAVVSFWRKNVHNTG